MGKGQTLRLSRSVPKSESQTTGFQRPANGKGPNSSPVSKCTQVRVTDNWISTSSQWERAKLFACLEVYPSQSHRQLDFNVQPMGKGQTLRLSRSVPKSESQTTGFQRPANGKGPNSSPVSKCTQVRVTDNWISTSSQWERAKLFACLEVYPSQSHRLSTKTKD